MMWQQRLTALLKDELEDNLNHLSSIENLYELVREPLTKTRRGLNADTGNDTPWTLLPLIVCEAINGKADKALPAAAAMQFLFAAADVFDDIEDADSPDSLYAKYGLAAAVSAASTLLILGERSLTRLHERGVEAEIVVQVMDTLNSYYTIACAGQHLDILLSRQLAVSEDEYLKVIAMKTSAQVECACHVGALIAGASDDLINMLIDFARNLGMASQLGNDIRGIIGGNDIVNRRHTLPVIFALAQDNGDIKDRLENMFLNRMEPIVDPAPVKDLLFQSGAMHYTTVKTEYYRQLALDALGNIEKEGVDTTLLKAFLT